MSSVAKLSQVGIEVLEVDVRTHFVVHREEFLALIERRSDGSFGAIGAAGMLTEKGLAPLVWRGERAFFVAKSLEQEATPAQVDRLRAFQADLESALG